MLKQRVFTALVLLFIILIAIYGLSSFHFSLFLGAVILLAAWEWSSLAGLIQPLARILYVLLFSVLLVLSQTLVEAGFTWVMLVNLGWLCLVFVFVFCYPRYSQWWGKTGFLAVAGGFVLLPGWVAILYLRSQQEFAALILLFLALVVAADIGAYFSGRTMGTRKLAPAVSPNKTWEGFLGGIASCCVLICLVALYYTVNFSSLGLLIWFELIAFSILLGTVSVIGDLLESMVKRFRGVKDSGNILPGHGGILDRIDSIVAAAPVYALLVMTVRADLP